MADIGKNKERRSPSQPRRTTPTKLLAVSPRATRGDNPLAIETSLVRPLEDHESQVLQAAALVSEEIRSGAWPCGFSEQRKKQQRPNDSATDEAILTNVALQAYRNQLAGMVEMFAREIILPSMLSFSTPAPLPRTSLPENRRAFLGTMLALREVMTQNDEMFFGGRAIITDSVELSGEAAAATAVSPNGSRESDVVDLVWDSADETDSKVAETDKKMAAQSTVNSSPTAISEKHSDGVDNEDTPENQRLSEEEEHLYSARLLATGVVLSATLRLLKPGQVIHDELLRLIDSYDAGGDEFAACLESTDGNWRGVLPNGSCLNRDETIAWKASFNRAREEHPLIVQSKRRKLEQSCAEAKIKWNRESEAVMIAKPNLCFAGVVEDLTAVMLDRSNRLEGISEKSE